MIKVIAHITQAIIALVTGLLFASCGFNSNGIEGSGNVINQARTVNGDFTAVNAANGLEVYIEQGTAQSVTVEADDNLQPHIITAVNDGVLNIYADVNNIRNATKRITVTLPEIKGIVSSSGAAVKSKNVFRGDKMGFTAESGSSLEVAVDAGRVNCESSSGSGLKISGKAISLESRSGSGSSLDAKGLVANIVTAVSSSGSTTVVNAVESLTADASSGSSVNYINAPSRLSKKISSGGSVGQE